jgi:hypothetical protein
MFLHLDINKQGADMISKKQALIDEQTSPLQRIMWSYNADDPLKRTFENNICTFHIGNGYFLSVAHNLRVQAGYLRSIDEELYRKEIFPKLDGSQNRFLDQHYFTDDYTRKRYLNTNDPAHLQNITNILKQKRFDTRWAALAAKKICRPYLVFHFKNNQFYNEPWLTRQFDVNHIMYEPAIHKHTFLLEVELINAFYGADIALYRTVNASPEVISKIPHLDIDYNFYDESVEKLSCLQSSPTYPTGRLLNEAKIEGMLDHFNVFIDEIGGNYLLEGYRYLIKGYFRFGSSGAPYVVYNTERDKYMVNAIQSEASGIQFSIKNDQEGNIQYINAIASPLSVIKEELELYRAEP